MAPGPGEVAAATIGRPSGGLVSEAVCHRADPQRRPVLATAAPARRRCRGAALHQQGRSPASAASKKATPSPTTTRTRSARHISISARRRPGRVARPQDQPHRRARLRRLRRRHACRPPASSTPRSILLDASAGVEVGTEQAWSRRRAPAAPASSSSTRWTARTPTSPPRSNRRSAAFGASVVPLQIPIGAESGFKGVVDLLRRTGAISAAASATAPSPRPTSPPSSWPRSRRYRDKLVEKIAENDDELIEKYLEDEPIGDDELIARARTPASPAAQIVPVLCGSATLVVGAAQLLDALVARPVAGRGQADRSAPTRHRQERDARRRPGRPAGGAGLQDARDPVRQADLRPRLLRHARLQLATC